MSGERVFVVVHIVLGDVNEWLVGDADFRNECKCRRRLPVTDDADGNLQVSALNRFRCERIKIHVGNFVKTFVEHVVQTDFTKDELVTATGIKAKCAG